MPKYQVALWKTNGMNLISPSQKRWLAVYASSSDAVDPGYLLMAEKIGYALGDAGWNLVYGGSNVGSMGRVAKGFKKAGKSVLAVIPEKIQTLVPTFVDADETIVTKTMSERKNIMIDKADGFLALPGGFGTLEEIAEVITLKQLGYHSKPIIFYNHRNYFRYLLQHFEMMYINRFAKQINRIIYKSLDDIDEIAEYLKNYHPPQMESKWFDTKDSFSAQV